MNLISTIIIIAGRFIFKILITVFNWAMEIFFGKMPREIQKKRNIVAILSVAWVILVFGTLYPAVVQTFYNYIPDKEIRSLVTFWLGSFGIFVMPVIVGYFVTEMNRKKDEKINYFYLILDGFYYSFYIGRAMLIMFILAPFITLKRFVLQRKTLSLSVIFKSKKLEIISEIVEHFNRIGYTCEVNISKGFGRKITKIMKNPFAALFGLKGTNEFIIKSENFTMYFFNFDICILSNKEFIETLKIELLKILIHHDIYLTWGEEANSIEDRLFFIRELFKKGALEPAECFREYEKINRSLAKKEIDFYEWQVISMRISLYEKELELLNLPSFSLKQEF